MDCPVDPLDSPFDLNTCYNCDQYTWCASRYMWARQQQAAEEERQALLREEERLIEDGVPPLFQDIEVFLDHYLALRREGATTQQAMQGTAYTLYGEGQQ